MNDKIIRKLPPNEALAVHNFNRSLGKQNEGFYRWYEDIDVFNERNGLTYHYVEYNDKNYRIEYMPKDNKLVFTGDVSEIDTSDLGPDFDDEDY